MTAFKSQHIHVADDGARLYVRERAAVGAPAGTVVLLPSLFFGAAMFESLAALLPADWRLLCPDHRGQCLSASGDVAPSIGRLASDTASLIESFTDGPVHLVGSSMGGYVAMALASTRPELVRSCVLSCCTAHAEQQPERFAALEAALRRDGAAKMAGKLLETMFGAWFLEHEAAGVAHWRAAFEAIDDRIADAVHEVFARPSMADTLPALGMPLLLLSGELDRAKRPADMQFIADHVPGSRHVVLPQSGHTPPVEQPAEVARALDAFWRAA